jgi:hypothetical protein
MLGNRVTATAILQRNLMDAIGVDDNQRGFARYGILAIHAGMVELNFEAKGLQRYGLK